VSWNLSDVLRPSYQSSTGPLVLLAIHDGELRTSFAYDLAAHGFDVAVAGFAAMDDARAGGHSDESRARLSRAAD